MASQLFEICAILISLPVLWIILIISVVIALPSYIASCIVSIIAQILHPEWAGMVTNTDIVFTEDPSSCEIKPRSILLGYSTVSNGLTIQELQQGILNNLVLSRNPHTGKLYYPKLQQYFERWLSFSFWKWEDSFDIRTHVRQIADSTELITEDKLLELLGHLSNEPFKPQMSPWEDLFIPQYLPKGSTVPLGLVIKRVHHSIGDGFSLLKSFINYSCGDTLDKLVVGSSNKIKKGQRSKQHFQVKVSRVGRLIWKILAAPYDYLKHMLTIDQNPWFLPKTKLHQECHVGMTGQIPVSTIKTLSQHYGVSFSAVLFGLIGGGIERFLKKRNLETEFPKQIQCLTPFPRPGHPNNKMVNHFTTAIIKLFPSASSAQERFELNEKDLNEMKVSTFPLLMHFLLSVLSSYPTFYVRWLGANWFATSILSNFPGPSDYVSYFQKYQIPDMVFWAPHLNGSAGIGISMLTYVKSLRFALNVDSAILSSSSQVQELCACIEEEVLYLSLFDSSINQSDETKSNRKSDENQNRRSIKNSTDSSELRLRSLS